jgi:cyclopropane-fatty-acyl-phospholipid synthase
MSASHRAARSIVLALLRRIEVGTLVVAHRGRHHTIGSGPPVATIEVRDPRFWRAMLRGSRGMAQAYSEGWWDSPDLVAVIRLAARNSHLLDAPRRRLAFVRGPLQWVSALARPATRHRSREDISAHYDLGNELFSRMLDSTLSYSCAVFDEPTMTLEAAQIAKLERICSRLELAPSDRLLEIGTGWGALAIYAARTRGCHVTTTTISREQYDYARALVRRAGLQDRVTVLMQDYRDLRGRYDKLVSIEMIEAVGWRGTGQFFATCSDLLESDGAMLLQAITIDDRAYEVEKISGSFIRTYIFPGGSLPSMEVIARNVARRTDMQMLHLDDITRHYVETLRRWRERFDAHAAELRGLGYDEGFRRLWTLYLSYCEAGFAERRICDVQLLLGKPRHRLGHAEVLASSGTAAVHPAAAAHPAERRRSASAPGGVLPR